MLSKLFGRGKEPEKPKLEELPKLEDLLEKLPSDEKEFAQIGAVRADLSKNPDYAAKASSFYADKGSGYDLMAKFEILKGNPEGAIAIYTNDYPFIEEAAKIAKNHISLERAIQIYEKAIEKKEGYIARYLEEIARLYQEKGDNFAAKRYFQLAITAYEKESFFNEAEALEREHGNLENAVEMFVRAAESSDSHNKAAFYYSAIEVAEEIGNQEKVNQLNEKLLDAILGERFLFNANQLINIAQKVGNKDKLISAYLKSGQIQKACELALEEGNTKKVEEISSIIRNPEEINKLAKFILEKGYNADLAITLYERAGDTKKAARTALNYANPYRAVEICRPMIDTPHENGYFRDPDYYEIAMDAYSKTENENAKKNIGQKAIQRFAALGQFDVSAKFAEKLGDTEKANTYRLLASLAKA